MAKINIMKIYIFLNKTVLKIQTPVAYETGTEDRCSIFAALKKWLTYIHQ